MDLVIWVIVCIVLSAYFSGMETAYTSFDKILVESWRRVGKFGVKSVHYFSVKPHRFLTATLIGTNIADVAYSSLFVLWAEDIGLKPVWMMIISPFVILIFGSIFPKMIAYGLANNLVLFASFPLRIFYVIFAPVNWILTPFTRMVSREPHQQAHTLRRSYFFIMDELDLILHGAEEAGAATPEEGELLSRFLDAREMKVTAIMTPRTQMIAISSQSTLEDARALVKKYRYQFLPVYKDSLDHVIGYIRAHDLFVDQEFVYEIMKPILAVPESKLIVDLLKDFRLSKQQVAVVIDEHGGTDGFVTITDILYELVGSMAERWDPANPVIKRLTAGKYLVSGSAFLDDITEKTEWEPPRGDYNTLSGLLSDHLGRIAEAGEDVNIDGVIIRIIRRNPKRVEGCLLKLPPTEK